MTDRILQLYDYLAAHKGRLTVLLVVMTLVLGLLVLHIRYKEDISDFLPLDGNHQQAMRLYQSLSGADRIYVMVGKRGDLVADPDSTVEAVADFANRLTTDADIAPEYIVAQADMEHVNELTDFVYENIPYFLTDADYRRMERQMTAESFVRRQLETDKQWLQLPAASWLTSNMSRDPLQLFTPVVSQLNRRNQGNGFELYDGYIFTPDMRQAIVIIDSPYGSSETQQNRELLKRINHAAAATITLHPDIDIHLTGGPVIAVGNAQRIKTDSLLSVSVAVVLILILLTLYFRSARNLSLIAVSIAWGWLFAMGGLSLVHKDISVIVIGISSIILGIAVNYPLHLVAHLQHTPDVRRALHEIAMPLLVGNITTIGAFLTLVPLQSVALRDLGLFAALLLAGTILFVLLFLPHMVKPTTPQSVRHGWRTGRWQLENHPWLVGGVAVLTLVLAYFSPKTEFDTNLSHINYLSAEQQRDLDSMSRWTREDPREKTLYVVSTGKTADEALTANARIQPLLNRMTTDKDVRGVDSCAQFLTSKAEQQRRLQRWNTFVAKYGNRLAADIKRQAPQAGFSSGAFDDFIALLSRHFQVQDIDYFSPLSDNVLRGHLSHDPQQGTYSVVERVKVSAAGCDRTMQRLNRQLAQTDNPVTGKGSQTQAKHYIFEIGKLNSTIADNLSDNFNYIGIACGFIVFFFLWLSMGNLELASLSFLPMAVSWIWILGLMAILGIKFNIINIILATFIFGQGDDYTIFMTEGCQYEYAYGRKTLDSYRGSIMLSALIMFIGIGSLITARHPALRSLAEVTIVGMFSVVLMAYLLPPFIFRWLTTRHGLLRRRPLTLRSLLMPGRYPDTWVANQGKEECRSYVCDVYYYCGLEIVRTVKAATSHATDYIITDGDKAAVTTETDNPPVIVAGGNYGAVALMLALEHPEKTILALTSNDDDADVCRQMACRVAPNITIKKETDDK